MSGCKFLVALASSNYFFLFRRFLILDVGICVLAALLYVSRCMSSRRKAFGGAFET
jgi:hypothetical protein